MLRNLKKVILPFAMLILVSQYSHAGLQLVCKGESPIGGMQAIYFDCNDRQEAVDMLRRAWQTLRQSSHPTARAMESTCFESIGRVRGIHDGMVWSAALTGATMCNRGLLHVDLGGAAKQAVEPDRPTRASRSPHPKEGTLRVAFAYVGPVGNSGWTFAHELGRKAVEKKFGNRISASFVEGVPESADAERVIRDLAQQGNKLIFGTTFGYMDHMLKVAEAFKDVKFEHALGYKSSENMRTYDSRTYEGAYIAGVIAGKMTITNNLGVVASIPIPEVIRNINSFTLGAQSVNPKITTRVVWVNDWFDPTKESAAAASLINGGADVLLQNTDSSAVLHAAEKMGKRAFGWNSDMRSYAPRAHLGSVVTNWGPYYIKAVQDVLDNKWTGNSSVWWGVKEGAIDMVSLASDVPEEIRKRISRVKAGLSDGSFVIWKGPIVGQDGREVLASGAMANDSFLAAMNFYVKGVEGKVPGSN